MYESPYVECETPDCKNRHKGHYPGSVKADGWIRLKDGRSFCHVHAMSWKSKKEDLKLSVDRKNPLPENTSDLLESLGWVFKELRKENNWFVEDFAKEVKATSHRVRELEKGERDIKISTLVKWADALGYEVSIEFSQKEDEE